MAAATIFAFSRAEGITRSRAMLKFILRDGFDACEEDVRENLLADAEFAAGQSVAHRDSMNQARAVIAAHSRRHNA